MNNPLTAVADFCRFNDIKVEDFAPTMEELMQRYSATVARVIAEEQPCWDNTIKLLEEIGVEFDYAWNIINHLEGVQNTPEVRAVYDELLPKVSGFFTDIYQNEKLYNIYNTLLNSPAYQDYPADRQAVIQHAIRDYKLSGVNLPAAQRAEFKENEVKRSELSNKYSNNVLDATEGWDLFVAQADKEKLAGIPEDNLAIAANKAKKQGKDGYLIGIDFPSLYSVIQHAKNAALRKEVYQAYSTRASDVGPNAGKWDNTATINEIMAARQKSAEMLGYKNYGEVSLVPKMAATVTEVTGFLQEIGKKIKDQAKAEYLELLEFAKGLGDLEGDSLEIWDITYYSERYKETKYQVSQEELRKYFPEDKVFAGLFALTKKLYGFTIVEVEQDAYSTYDPLVKLYKVIDRAGQDRGYFYTDLYTREGKRGGAWAADQRFRNIDANGKLHLPINYLCCNFTPPVDGSKGYLTHHDVVTVFHEFGHVLHMTVTVIDTPSVSGGCGVEWDAIELPSQFMENWAWEYEVLRELSSHKDTGEQLPEAMFNNLLTSKNFQAALALSRQVEYSLLDMRIHSEQQGLQAEGIQKIIDEVRANLLPFKIPEWHRFQHSFTHIFSGGYAAGYYSYLWAEVLSSDTFDIFKEHGLYDRKVADAFLHNILEQGASKPAKELFLAFAGREPAVDALLTNRGISSK